MELKRRAEEKAARRFILFCSIENSRRLPAHALIRSPDLPGLAAKPRPREQQVGMRYNRSVPDRYDA
jgi:hypothetical protein